ncbi:MAG: hypothetical protein HYU51_16330 [Candidatus Rokubacteria bacterium]|nr:hypothetical protein [Candidatus Rokubacteria bacterium]
MTSVSVLEPRLRTVMTMVTLPPLAAVASTVIAVTSRVGILTVIDVWTRMSCTFPRCRTVTSKL